MRYLYYTIYLFYKKVIKIEYLGDTSFFYSNLILGFFETIFLFTIFRFYLLYFRNGQYIDYSEWWFFCSLIILYSFNVYYFNNRKNNIIKTISSKSKKNKILIIVMSSIFLFCIILLYLYSSTLIRINNGFYTCDVWAK